MKNGTCFFLLYINRLLLVNSYNFRTMQAEINSKRYEYLASFR